MTVKHLHLLGLLFLGACSSSPRTNDAGAAEGATIDASDSDRPDSSASTDGGSCQWPASANTLTEAGGSGCIPAPFFRICEIPNDGSVQADGAIVSPDGALVTDSCTNACASDEYALNCRGNPEAPEPDSSLGCNVIPIPGNLPTSMHYCCRCAS